jgi:hypothetical protein
VDKSFSNSKKSSSQYSQQSLAYKYASLTIQTEFDIISPYQAQIKHLKEKSKSLGQQYDILVEENGDYHSPIDDRH